MAGEDPNGAFDADDFRLNIRATMLMGLPEDESLRPIFHFPRERDWAIEDHGGQPLDWLATPTSDSNDDPGEPRIVTCGEADDQVVCTWDAAGGRGGTQSSETPFGDFDTERLTLVLLDVDRAKIDGFDRVVVGGQEFKPQFEQPAAGLFDVTVYQIVVQAIDARVVKSS